VRAVEVVWTTAFADGANGGNPCPVVPGADDLGTGEMQSIARELGFETAFVLRARADGHARLRFFVPEHEMEMCVHATIASTVLLARRGDVDRPALIETPLATRHVDWDIDAGEATVALPGPSAAPPVEDLTRLIAALGCRITDLDLELGPVQAVSVARPKLMVPFLDEPRLDALAPDFPRWWSLCDELGVTGVYALTRRASDAEIAARQFPVRAGYVEDAATGVAAGACACHLASSQGPEPPGWREWTIAQGRAMGRPSRLRAAAFVEPTGEITSSRVAGTTRRLTDDEVRAIAGRSTAGGWAIS
jgi:PhzF family phenazine biosynthesis protein